MARREKVKFEAFNDGACSLWALDENQNPVRQVEVLHYQNRVVGAKRNYLAEQAGHTIERVIRIPYTGHIGKNFFVVMGDFSDGYEQYQVARSQIIPDTVPKCTDLTLEQPDILLEFNPEEAGAGGRE